MYVIPAQNILIPRFRPWLPLWASIGSLRYKSASGHLAYNTTSGHLVYSCAIEVPPPLCSATCQTGDVPTGYTCAITGLTKANCDLDTEFGGPGSRYFSFTTDPSGTFDLTGSCTYTGSNSINSDWTQWSENTCTDVLQRVSNVHNTGFGVSATLSGGYLTVQGGVSGGGIFFIGRTAVTSCLDTITVNNNMTSFGRLSSATASATGTGTYVTGGQAVCTPY